MYQVVCCVRTKMVKKIALVPVLWDSWFGEQRAHFNAVHSYEKSKKWGWRVKEESHLVI